MIWLSDPAAAGEGNAPASSGFVAVSINGVDQDVAVVARTSGGAILVPAASLQQWRLRLPAHPPIMVDGEPYYALSELAGVDGVEDKEAQRLELDVAPEAFEATRLSVAANGRHRPQASSFGAYLNYDLLAERSDGKARVGGAFEANIFSRLGVLSTNVVAQSGGDSSSFRRIESSWTIDDPEKMTTWRVGDNVTSGGTGGAPLRFGGVRYGRNFAVQPGFITFPSPTIDGRAATPSVVDVYVNNVLSNQREVGAGPFALQDLPVVTGSGEVRLVVRDPLGRETLTTQSFYATPLLLRPGLHDFSYEIGFLRHNFASPGDGYGELIVSGTHRYGFSPVVTGELHVEAGRHKQVIGASAAILPSRLGLFSLSAAASRSRKGNGTLIGISFERQAGGFSLGAGGELTSRNYTNLGFADGEAAPAATARAFIGLPTAFGSLSANYLLRSERDGPDLQVIGGSASIGLGEIGNLHFSAQRVIAPQRTVRFGLFLTRSLGPMRHAAASVEFGSGRRASRVAVQQSLPVGEGFGYRVAASEGDSRRLEGWSAYQGPRGLYEAEVAHSKDSTGIRLGTSGSVGWMTGNVFTARRLTEAFAQVRVDGVEGVRVYANNQLVGKTGKAGRLLIPRLLSYEANQISIEPADVPFEYDVPEFERTVRPFLRSGVVVNFSAARINGGLIKVVTKAGTPLAEGSLVTNLDTGAQFSIVAGGEAYVTGLLTSNRMRASNGKSICEFTLSYTESADTQRLGTFVCEPGSYAVQGVKQ
jgi:outer membrane usher protein